MIIKKLKLKNIRSYVEQEIVFPVGNVLLSGNIGSGKTSLLLAIDFVLFGLRRGSLSGNSLLRHGADSGSVELNFEINGKDVVIKRTLKRGKNGVSQDFGYIGVDGVNFEGTAVQLKQKVLELFNYPKEYLTKSKSLIYNYTIYTPQEEMKSILLGDSEERLNIIRKVFGIDKYERIVSNSKIVVSRLKERKKELEFMVSGLIDKVNERDEKKARFANLKANLNEFEEKLKVVREKLDYLKKEISSIEEIKIKRDNLVKEIELIENNLRNILENRAKNKELIERLQQEINSLEEDVKHKGDLNLESLNQKILMREEDIRMNDVNLKSVLKKITEAELRINEANKNKEEIIKLNYCPYCKQNVSEDHKTKIIELEDRKIKENKEVLEDAKSKEKEIEKLILELKSEVEQLRKQKNAYELYKYKRESLDRKYKQLEELINEQNSLKKKIGELNSRKIEVNLELENIKVDGYEELKSELDVFLDEEKNLIMKKSKVESEMEILVESIDRLEKEIEVMEKLKEKIVKYSELIFWFEKDFVNFVKSLEKSILMRVYSEFDKLFKDWFRILVDDESLKVRLDSNFTPLIEQNGHDSDYLYLSGGEKTAIALAYRLALNQVINTVMSEINTKDVLILDEPTDGFSEEQVDKIRYILEQLGVKQVIIVSHDPKIESFVDHVIRFEKVDGVSYVYS